MTSSPRSTIYLFYCKFLFNRSSRLPSDPPDWAKKLLKQQEENAAELKWLQGELTGAKSHKSQQPSAADPEFRSAGNKKQYFLNRDVAG